jgi:hypothetical protein
MAKHPCRNCIYFKQCGNSTRTEECKGRKTALNVCRIAKKHGIGEVSSKYGYDLDGSQFEADIKAHKERHKALYAAFVDWMKEQKVTPDQLRYMFTRYYEEFLNPTLSNDKVGAENDSLKDGNV